MPTNNYPTVFNGGPVDAERWFNQIAIDLSALSGIQAQVDALPRGVVARGRRITNSPGSASATLVPVLRVPPTPLEFGRLYEITTGTIALDGTAANDIPRITITHTLDGTTPVFSSSTLPGGIGEALQANASFSENVLVRTFYTPSLTTEQLSLLLCVSRATGAGTVNALADGTLNLIDLVVLDVGIDPGDTGIDL